MKRTREYIIRQIIAKKDRDFRVTSAEALEYRMTADRRLNDLAELKRMLADGKTTKAQMIEYIDASPDADTMASRIVAEPIGDGEVKK